jgi:ABC-2 type transport system ATP-binding protein
MEALIEAKGLRKTFRVTKKLRAGLGAAVKGLFKREFTTVHAVDGIDLSVPRGEIRGLIGPNGAGKSTTIKMLCGILYPTAGQVTCLGFTPWKERLSYVQRIGALFGQKSQLLWDLPALDTFALNRKMYKIPAETFKRNLEYFTDSFGLSELLSKPVRNLSLGERMRCELVAALLHDPDLVFLDEPTIGLDLLAKDAVRAFIKRVNKERGVTFLLTTHDLDDVADLCRRITVINRGVVVFDRTMEELNVGYVHKKRLELKFSRAVEDSELSEWTVLEHQGASCVLSLTSEKKAYSEQILAVLTRLPVLDIWIKNPEIESIIREIYKTSADGSKEG